MLTAAGVTARFSFPGHPIGEGLPRRDVRYDDHGTQLTAGRIDTQS